MDDSMKREITLFADRFASYIEDDNKWYAGEGIDGRDAQELGELFRDLSKVMAHPTCGYCRDCRWWRRREHALMDENSFGRCLIHTEDRALITSYEPIWTSGSFGCIQWEEVETE